MKKAKRLCSLLLAVMLIFCSMQAAVFAAQKTEQKEGTKAESTAKSGSAEAQKEAAAKSGSAEAKKEAAAKTGSAEVKTDSSAAKKEAAAKQAASAAQKEAAAIFEKKVKELEKQYGVMKAGKQAFKADAKEFYTSMESPIEARTDGGILFTDIRDYDLDGAPELLILRRARDMGALVENGEAFESDMYEYVFDMYEVSDKNCELAASHSICVFDVINWSINFKSITVFLHETDKFVDIFAETFISQQDHPSDTAVVRIRYNGDEFADENGIRFGYWYSEKGVRCMRPVSEAALNYLSDMFPSEETFWKDIVRTESETDQKYLQARNERMQKLGFKIVQTRQDIIEKTDMSEMNDAELAKMDAKFSAISAMDCYAPVGGSMTKLAFLHEYIEREMDQDGNAIINRTLDTEKKTVK